MGLLSRLKSKKGGKDKQQAAADPPPAASKTEFAVDGGSTCYSNLPPLPIMPLLNPNVSCYFEGPTGDETVISGLTCLEAGIWRAGLRFLGQHLPVATWANAPRWRSHLRSLCDPNRTIAVLADGCNWGERPRAAAVLASNTVLEYICTHQGEVKDVKQAGELLLRALEAAHTAITSKSSKENEAGTTTLLAGMLLEMDKQDVWVPPWQFVCCSVGDCKGFAYQEATGRIDDITPENRTGDARDCGGRLGPHLEGGRADLRNLNLFCESFDEGDAVLLISDGVHDNLDPEHLGRLPTDMSREFGLIGNTWKEVDPDAAERAKANFRNTFLQAVFAESTAPSVVVDAIIHHCVEVTQKGREWMEAHPGKRLPSDYITFPGKMDHTTALVFKVGYMSEAQLRHFATLYPQEPTLAQLPATEPQPRQAARDNEVLPLALEPTATGPTTV